MATDFLLDADPFLEGPVACLPDPPPHHAAPAPAAAPPATEDRGPDDAPPAAPVGPAVLSRRQRARRGALAKIDSVYLSVHAFEIVARLLEDARDYLRTLADEGAESLGIPCDCLLVAIDGLEQHGAIISQAIVNSSETPEVKYAQRKLIKRQERSRRTEGGVRPLNRTRGVMERDPKTVLASARDYARETLEDLLDQTSPDFLTEKARARKRKARGEGSGAAAAEPGGAAAPAAAVSPAAAPDVIALPRPAPGAAAFSPLEAVAYIRHVRERSPANKTYVRAYKEKMMVAGLVPVQRSQLNALVKQHGGPAGLVAPLHWNEKCAKDYFNSELLTKFRAKQNAGGAWSIEDTRSVLVAAAAENNKPAPTEKIIETHHAKLILLHNRQNHINEQLVIQERRLRERPPSAQTGKVDQKSLKRIRFDKKDKKYAAISLPPPSEGNLIYTPTETVAHVMAFIRSDPTPNRVAVRAFKEKMIAEKIVPISISQLNALVSTHGGPGKEPAPRNWSQKGASELISIEDLAQKVNESLAMWTIDDTLDVVWAKKKEKLAAKAGAEGVKCPDRKTVNAYHTALLSIPEIAHKVIKPDVVKLKPGPKGKNYCQLIP